MTTKQLTNKLQVNHGKFMIGAFTLTSRYGKPETINIVVA